MGLGYELSKNGEYVQKALSNYSKDDLILELIQEKDIIIEKQSLIIQDLMKLLSQLISIQPQKELVK